MKTSFVSNLAIQNAMRLTIQQTQTDMIKLQQEVTTGVYADVGVSLGGSVSRSLDLQREMDRMTTLKTTNTVVASRLSASQAALKTMAEAAEKINGVNTALSGTQSADQLKIAQTEITNALSVFNGAANTSFNGEFLFSGINTDVKPLADYTTSEGAAAKAAYNAALSTFMGAQVPPLTSVSQFSKTQMDSFINNTLQPMYVDNPAVAGDQSQWSTNWSKASNQNMTSRISTTEVVTSSANANSEGMRRLALAGVIATELLGADLSTEARSVVSSAITTNITSAISGVNAQASSLGIAEARVKKANTSLEAQIKLVKTHLLDIEGIDTYEAGVRLNTLKTQLETSYTLTTRLQQLSLINYL